MGCSRRRAPDALYENGLQRDLFLPFIARLQQATRVLDIASGTDYRQLAQHRRGLFYTPADFPDPDAEAEAQFASLAAACHEPVVDARVEVAMGRHLSVPAASARFSSLFRPCCLCMSMPCRRGDSLLQWLPGRHAGSGEGNMQVK